jgi:hypothetical protein
MTYPSVMRLALAAALVLTCLAPACARSADNEITGVIIDIDSSGLNDVTSFTLKDGDENYEIFIDEEIDYGFPLGHLHEHVQTSVPMVVDTVERDGKLYAVMIVDA